MATPGIGFTSQAANGAFTSPGYDYSADVTKIQQQQALAQALQAQGLAPLQNGGMAGRVAIKTSPLEGAAKLLQTYAGVKGNERVVQQQRDLSAKSQTDYKNLLAQGLQQMKEGDYSGAAGTFAQHPGTAPFAASAMQRAQQQMSLDMLPAMLAKLRGGDQSAPVPGITQPGQSGPTAQPQGSPQVGGMSGLPQGSDLLLAGQTLGMPALEKIGQNQFDASKANRYSTHSGVVIDNWTGQVMSSVPNVGEGKQAVIEGGRVVGAQPLPGYLPAQGGIQYQKDYVTNLFQPEQVKTSQGQIVPMNRAQYLNAPPPPGMQANGLPAAPVSGPQMPPGQAPVARPTPPGPQQPVQTLPQNAPQQAPIGPVTRGVPGIGQAQPLGQPLGAFGPTISGEAEQKARGSDLAAQQQEIDTQANAAQVVRTRIDEMRGLLANFTPGALAPMKEKLGAVMQGMGISPDNPLMKQLGNVGDMQAFGKLALNLAFDQTKQLTNRPAASEVMLSLKANPNIALTPDGIQKILGMMDGMARYQTEKQQMAQAWKSKSGTLEGFDAWFNKNNSIKDYLPQEKKNPIQLNNSVDDLVKKWSK